MTLDLGPAPSFEVRVDDAGDHTVVSAFGELDLATAEEFLTAASEALAKRDVVVDLQQLTFIDSSGVRALAELVRIAKAQGRTLSVVPELQSNVRQVFDLTGLMNLIPFGDHSPE